MATLGPKWKPWSYACTFKSFAHTQDQDGIVQGEVEVKPYRDVPAQEVISTHTKATPPLEIWGSGPNQFIIVNLTFLTCLTWGRIKIKSIQNS